MLQELITAVEKHDLDVRVDILPLRPWSIMLFVDRIVLALWPGFVPVVAVQLEGGFGTAGTREYGVAQKSFIYGTTIKAGRATGSPPSGTLSDRSDLRST